MRLFSRVITGHTLSGCTMRQRFGLNYQTVTPNTAPPPAAASPLPPHTGTPAALVITPRTKRMANRPQLQPEPATLCPLFCPSSLHPPITPQHRRPLNVPSCPTLLLLPHRPCRRGFGAPSGSATPRVKQWRSFTSLKANACHVICLLLRRRPSPRVVK